LLRQAMDSIAKLSSFVMFILIGSSVFTLTFRGVNGDLWVESLLTGLPGGHIGFLVFVNAFVFVLAFFLDYFERRSSSSRCCARSPTSSASI
jgi:TRAP-type mannitol/chloroaromatic compound transport system permease large subunit